MSERFFGRHQAIGSDMSHGEVVQSASAAALARQTLLCIVVLLLAPGEAFSAPEKAMLDREIPVCIYASKSYSAGALFCVQKSIALICKNDGLHVSWVPVSDKDLAGRCVEPIVHARSGCRMRGAQRVRHSTPIPSSPKCFDFDGKRYCE